MDFQNLYKVQIRPLLSHIGSIISFIYCTWFHFRFESFEDFTSILNFKEVTLKISFFQHVVLAFNQAATKSS